MAPIVSARTTARLALSIIAGHFTPYTGCTGPRSSARLSSRDWCGRWCDSPGGGHHCGPWPAGKGGVSKVKTRAVTAALVIEAMIQLW